MDYQHHIWTPAHQFHSKWSKTTPHIIRRETTAHSSSISGPHRLSSVTLQPQLVGFSELWFPMNCLWPMTTLASSLVGSSLEVHFLQISPFTCVSATNKTQQLSLSRSLSLNNSETSHKKLQNQTVSISTNNKPGSVQMQHVWDFSDILPSHICIMPK